MGSRQLDTTTSKSSEPGPPRTLRWALRKHLLWVDGTAAGTAGVVVLALSGWLSGLHGLPLEVLLGIGATNLLYASYSISLASRATRSITMIKLLVFGNAGWVVVCLGLAIHFAGTATPFGLGHLLAEALFVGGLAGLEWRERYRLAGEGSLKPIT